MVEGQITEASIRHMVDVFYARVRQDEVLSPVFEKALADKWESHMPHMYEFWNKVLLGTGSFQGNVFGKHMALEGIGKEHFVRWLRFFRQTVQETQAPGDVEVTMVVVYLVAANFLSRAQLAERTPAAGSRRCTRQPALAPLAGRPSVASSSATRALRGCQKTFFSKQSRQYPIQEFEDHALPRAE